MFIFSGRLRAGDNFLDQHGEVFHIQQEHRLELAQELEPARDHAEPRGTVVLNLTFYLLALFYDAVMKIKDSKTGEIFLNPPNLYAEIIAVKAILNNYESFHLVDCGLIG